MNNFILFLRNELLNEIRNPIKWISPFLFSVVVMILFFFSFEDTLKNQSVFAPLVYLVCFFSVEIALFRSFDADHEDDALVILRIYPVMFEYLFLAKLISTTILSGILVLCTLFVGSFLFQQTDLLTLSSLFIFFSILAGLSALGLIIGSIVENSEHRRSLFSLFFFPLSVPLLLAGTQSSLTGLDFGSWGGLIVIFNIVYIGLGILCFPEFAASRMVDEFHENRLPPKT